MLSLHLTLLLLKDESINMRIQFEDAIVDLSPHVCHTIYKYVQHGSLPESGGILLGKYLPSEKMYFITEATTPSFGDKWGPAFFIRQKHSAQRIINKRWKDSNGQINYLGEWHTHGCDVPVPSETDKNLIRTIYNDRSNVWPNIIMIILGRKSCYIGISLGSSNGEIAEYKYIEGDDYALIFNR